MLEPAGEGVPSPENGVVVKIEHDELVFKLFKDLQENLLELM